MGQSQSSPQVGTTEKFMFMVPADQQENVKSAIAKYRELTA